ncbi:MAG TPA: hypothetical protein VFT97_00870 [Candidatus Eisenbacteria bacterium]|nr:hypothetical protein [Candidatus Eisenbacteria bacterium]
MLRTPLTWRSFVALLLLAGCSAEEPLLPPETFHWVAQPIVFAPPPPAWRREGDNGGGMLGVRFVLTGGGGQCLEIAAHRGIAERDRRVAISRLIARRDSLGRNEFLKEVSLARARTDAPLSEREAEAAQTINSALDRATSEYLEGRSGYVTAALYEALAAAHSYGPTLDDVRWTLRLRPDQMQEPDRWRIGRERDTTLAGHPAFAGDDTLITDERPLLYHEIIWVVNRCAFKATYQGTKENLETFQRVVASVQFPAGADSAR